MLLMVFPRKQDEIFNDLSIYFWDNCIFGLYGLGFSQKEMLFLYLLFLYIRYIFVYIYIYISIFEFF
jgi:hypothetical protein